MNQKMIRYRTLDPASIIRDVLRQWWGILLFSAAVALLVNVAANSLYKPMYSTSTTFVVTTRGTNTSIYQNISNASDTAARFRTVLESNILKRTVAKDLEVKAFDAVTSVQLLEETNLIVLRVNHRSALMAYKYLRSIMNNYSTVSDYVIRDVVLEVLEQPKIPTVPMNVNRAGSFMQLGFLGGFLIALLYVAYFSYLKDTVKIRMKPHRNWPPDIWEVFIMKPEVRNADGQRLRLWSSPIRFSVCDIQNPAEWWLPK